MVKVSSGDAEVEVPKTYSEFSELHAQVKELMRLRSLGFALPHFPKKCWTELFRYVCTKKRANKLKAWLNAVLQVPEAYPYAIYFLGISPEPNVARDQQTPAPVYDMLGELVALFEQAGEEARRPLLVSKVLDILQSLPSRCDVLFELGCDRFRKLHLENPILSLNRNPDFFAALELLKLIHPHLLQQSQTNLLHVLSDSEQAANLFSCWMLEGANSDFSRDLTQWKSLACPGHEEYLTIKYRFEDRNVEFLVELFLTAPQNRVVSAIVDPGERMNWDYRASEIIRVKTISESQEIQHIRYHMNDRYCDFLIELNVLKSHEDRVTIQHTLIVGSDRSRLNSCSYVVDRVPSSTAVSEQCKMTYIVHHDSAARELFMPELLGETATFRKTWLKLKDYLEKGDKRDMQVRDFDSMSEAVARKALGTPQRKHKTTYHRDISPYRSLFNKA